MLHRLILLDKFGLQGTKTYSYQDLRFATHNFGEENRIGKGGFGEVFKVINFLYRIV